MRVIKIFIACTLALGLFFFIYILNQSNARGVDQTYLLPQGFEGCVIIIYDVESAPPLKIENNEITYRVPSNGIIETSSPQDFGWVSKEDSGWFKTRAFYVDEQGEIIEQLPDEKIRFGATGSYQEEGELEQFYDYQIFGSREWEFRGCHEFIHNYRETH